MHKSNHVLQKTARICLYLINNINHSILHTLNLVFLKIIFKSFDFAFKNLIIAASSQQC